MSDPRLDDPRVNPRATNSDVRDPVYRDAAPRRAGSNATWAWIGGIAAVVLIAILIMGNWQTGTDTGTPMTANEPAATTPTSAPPARNVTPPTTTGSGATSPAPATAPNQNTAPTAPAQNTAPTQTTPAPVQPAPQTNQ